MRVKIDKLIEYLDKCSDKQFDMIWMLVSNERVRRQYGLK